MHVIQADLDRMKTLWNTHPIRANKSNEGGIPNDLYFLCEQGGKHEACIWRITISYYLLGLKDYSCICDDSDLQLCWQHAYEKPPPNIPVFTEIVMHEENLQLPTSPDEALTLYFDLINHIV